jgi:hypothetical protein
MDRARPFELRLILRIVHILHVRPRLRVRGRVNAFAGTGATREEGYKNREREQGKNVRFHVGSPKIAMLSISAGEETGYLTLEREEPYTLAYK